MFRITNFFQDQYRNQCKVPTTYSEEEISRIIVAIDHSSPVDKRDYLVLLLAAEYGCNTIIYGKESSELERYLIRVKEKYGDNDTNPLGDLEKLEQIVGKNYIAHYKLI